MSTEFYMDSDYETYEDTLAVEAIEEEPVVEASKSAGAFDAKVIGNTRLNLRESQSLDSPVVRVLLPHEKVLAYSDEHLNPEWFQIATKTGDDVGYVLRQFIVKDSEE